MVLDKDKLKKIIKIFRYILILVSIFAIIQGGNIIYKLHLYDNWIVSECTINSCYVDRTTIHIGPSVMIGSTRGIVYGWACNYTYNYNNFDYSGFGKQKTYTSNKNLAEEFISKHPVGSKERIHINPKNPNESIIFSEFEKTNFLNYILFFVGIIFLLIFSLFKIENRIINDNFSKTKFKEY